MPLIHAVGVGPGDPELLTRKAEMVLRRADVILAPVSNPSEASVALATIREFIDEERQQVIVHQFPMTSDRARLVPAWNEAAELIAGHAEAGREVAFITIGDPLFYSTFIYLLRILREKWPHLPVGIVPGISSINAAAAQAALPLVEAEEKMAVVPATAGIEQIAAALANFETVVLLKVKPLYSDILQLLRRTGRGGSTVFVERVGSPRQKILTDFAEISAHSPDYLSLLIVKQPCSS
ncbi:MAG: precorrin-2 C(20)-methyltransferase [Geobacteraceae bacterium GWC2_55_20]|nr:MAG: precorrin-2 C(20)-methyltransferase [Geobacteraceae bacterium GWC2_55_20]OGU21685.1 MAG: precorrin-2 C(20)-methyltransferase [Geobacteraceae bacterium GWF2_54_21]HBA72451.1 precorrin-2 C(20)-methyltransferase [Geobacter sp.]